MTQIETLNLSKGAMRELLEEGFKTADDVCSYLTDTVLTDISGIGPKYEKEILTTLEELVIDTEWSLIDEAQFQGYITGVDLAPNSNDLINVKLIKNRGSATPSINIVGPMRRDEVSDFWLLNRKQWTSYKII